MTEQVTKVKNEGRVAAGKRLVEWNRKNKENLVKNREEVATSGDSSVLSRDAGDQQEPQSRTSTVVYGGGAVTMLILVGGALYLCTRRATPATSSTPVNLPAPENDIFCMN